MLKKYINKLQKIKKYYNNDYKVIQKYLESRYIYTNNQIFKDEINRLKNKLINKQISDIDIINYYYKVFMKSKIKFDSLNTLSQKQKHMQLGQLNHYVNQIINNKRNFDCIEIDKNITKKDDTYYLDFVKVFEDKKVKNESIYYYACNIEQASDINNIQKLFSNEIINLDYLTNTHYNNNKIFFFKEKQDKYYNFKVDLSEHQIYKRVYYVENDIKEIYYIKENEIDIDDTVEIDEQDIKQYQNNLKFCLKALDYCKRNTYDYLDLLDKYKDSFKKLQKYNISFKQHLQCLKHVEKYFYDDYVIAKTNNNYHKIYKSNDYNRYFHATSINSAKKIIEEGIKTNCNLTAFDYNKIFFSPSLVLAKKYGISQGITTKNKVQTQYIIFECDLDEYEDSLYHYIHNTEYFVFNKIVKTDAIKRIYLVKDNIIQKEISKEELKNL